MSKFLKIIYLPLALVLVSCPEEEKPQNFGSYDEAYTALAGSGGLYYGVVGQIIAIRDLPDDFDGSLDNLLLLGLSKAGDQPEVTMLRKNSGIMSLMYNSSTGFWTWDTTETDETGSAMATGKLRFTPRAGNGMPTSATETMELESSIDGSYSESYEGGSFSLDLSQFSNVVVNGIVAYRDTTGNIHITGQNDMKIKSTYSEAGYGNFTISYKFNSTATDVTFHRDSSYPEGGVITFTMKLDVSGQGQSESFYVKGSMTFDGTNVAVLQFGGYTFHVDLDTGDIIDILEGKRIHPEISLKPKH